jgi:hypothetical protein
LAIQEGNQRKLNQNDTDWRGFDGWFGSVGFALLRAAPKGKPGAVEPKPDVMYAQEGARFAGVPMSQALKSEGLTQCRVWLLNAIRTGRLPRREKMEATIPMGEIGSLYSVGAVKKSNVRFIDFLSFERPDGKMWAAPKAAMNAEAYRPEALDSALAARPFPYVRYDDERVESTEAYQHDNNVKARQRKIDTPEFSEVHDEAGREFVAALPKRKVLQATKRKAAAEKLKSKSKRPKSKPKRGSEPLDPAAHVEPAAADPPVVDGRRNPKLKDVKSFITKTLLVFFGPSEVEGEDGIEPWFFMPRGKATRGVQPGQYLVKLEDGSGMYTVLKPLEKVQLKDSVYTIANVCIVTTTRGTGAAKRVLSCQTEKSFPPEEEMIVIQKLLADFDSQ